MKLKNGEIVDCVEAFKKLVGEKLPVKVSYNLARTGIALQEKLKVFDEVKTSLVTTYKITAEPSEDGKGQTIKTGGKPADLQSFLKELDELLNLEVEVVIGKVKLPEKIAGTCDKCSHNMDVPLQVEPSVLMALEKFIEVE